jgi:hypothetical protein
VLHRIRDTGTVLAFSAGIPRLHAGPVRAECCSGDQRVDPVTQGCGNLELRWRSLSGTRTTSTSRSR